jgi:ketosteroid isomerase-like protein
VTSMLADKNLTLSFAAATVDVGKGGDVAYTQGSYALTATNPKTKKPIDEKGSYVMVYKRQAGGDWKAIEDISTPEGTAVPAAPTKKTHAKGGHKKKK